MSKKMHLTRWPQWMEGLYAFYVLCCTLNKKRTSFVNAMMILVILITKKSPHIMLADDDQEDQELFTDAIAEIEPKIQVSIANNGRELMKMLNDETVLLPDVIFLDINMPFKNGQECLAEIRGNDRLKSIPIIIYTTSSSRNHIDETYKGGANYYISKPDSFQDLKAVTKKMLSMDWDNAAQPNKDKYVVNAKGI